MTILRFTKSSSAVIAPEYKTSGAAGADIAAFINADIILPQFTPMPIPTGLFFEIPNGFELQVRSRSGLSLRGVVVANSPGTIDSDYRGELKVILVNFLPTPFIITNSLRIAQIILAQCETANFIEISKEELTDTNRGTGGFGSTGM